MKRRRIREIALASQTRFAVTAALWLSLFAYAGRPLLAGAAAAGLAPALGWTILLVAALLPALPMLSGARSSIHGLDFLKNEHRVIERGAAKLVMAGVTDPMGRDTHRQDPARALANAPADAVKVLLSHRPQTAPAASRLGVHLQLSGHTHGGQFFPFNLLIHKFQPIAKGLHRVGRTWLYVNRGTGYWGPPTRLAVGGEITVVSLSVNKAPSEVEGPG